MIYKVQVYGKGFPMSHVKIEAATQLAAAKKVAKPFGWSHVLVEGKTPKRYGRGYKALKNFTLHKMFYKAKCVALFAMFDNVTEIYLFGNEKDRDARFEEVSKCTVFPFVEYAKVNPEQTDTTASSEETKGSENFSTSLRTSNGFATSVIWQDLLTPGNIDKSSGTPKYAATGTKEWFDGYEASHSKQSQISFVTVKDNLPNISNFPGVNDSMKKMTGKTIKVKLIEDNKKHNGNFKGLYLGEGWYWKKRWLDFNHASLKLNNSQHLTWISDKGVEIPYIRVIYKTRGKVRGRMSKCFCGCGSWLLNGKYYAPTWLEPYNPDTPRLEPLTDEEKKIATLPFANDTSKWMKDMRHE